MTTVAASGLQPGQLIDDKYEILTLLGAGGMGEVYKVRHIHLNAFRCIKVMKAGLLSDESYRQRFLREARLATQIHHPNIAIVHDFSILPGGTTYMVTEFIEGSTLRQWSTAHGRFPLALATEVVTQVLAGLEHIHRRGLLHRDISADNIMITFDADEKLLAKIIDLGVAKDVSAKTDMTQSGMLIGNPKYMSPEQLGQIADNEQLDGRADLYCLGVVLYEMLVGVPPFESKTPHGYLMKHLTQPPPPFKELNPELSLPDGVEEAVLKALQKDRKNRYATAREFSDAMGPYMARSSGSYTKTEVSGLRKAEATVVQPAAAAPPEPATPPPPVIADEDAFQMTWEKGSSAGWQKFVDEHPDSPRAAAARELLAEARAYEAAVGEATTGAFRDFIKAWPEGRHRMEATIRLAEFKQKEEETDWAAAVARDSAGAIREFLAAHPASERAPDAHRALGERMAFENALAADSVEGWDRYLADWGSDRHADDARELQQEARRRARRRYDDEDFADAQSHDTVAAWRLYLTVHADGAHRDAAVARLQTLEREEASAIIAARDAEAAADFLRDAPDSPHRPEVERALEEWKEEAADDAAWEQAKAADTLASLESYMAEHEAGRWVGEARRRISAMRAEVAAREPRDWDTAWERGTSAAWDEYLSLHGESARAAEARQWREEAAEFELATRLNTATMWRAFVKAWPEGRHRLDAEIRLKSAR